jgi:hypothetical protein
MQEHTPKNNAEKSFIVFNCGCELEEEVINENKHSMHSWRKFEILMSDKV